RRFPPQPRLGARTPERRQFLPYRGGLGFPRRRPDLRRPARSRRSPWLPSHRPHRRPPFQRWRLHHNQLVPSPLPLSFHCAALVLLSASLAGLSRGAYPLSSLQHPDSPSLHLPHLLRGARPLRAHNKRSPPQNLLPGERERYTSLQPRSASSRS